MVAKFILNDAWWQRRPARSASENELEQVDEINDEAAAKILRDFSCSVEKKAPSPKETLRKRSGRRQIRKVPKLLKAVLFVGISGLGLLGIRILLATPSEGWVPAIALLAAFGLLLATLIEVKRNK